MGVTCIPSVKYHMDVRSNSRSSRYVSGQICYLFEQLNPGSKMWLPTKCPVNLEALLRALNVV